MGEATCQTCPFWDCDPADLRDGLERPCRVRSPAAYTVHRREVADSRDAAWPYTKATEWCGEHPARQRDRLAAMAMQGLITTWMPDEKTVPHLARVAYLTADAMLAERAKGTGHGP